jgi:DNA-binding transcriptional ArsR family regulator
MTGASKDTSSATWKFEFLATVNSDPMAKGECLGVIAAFLHFASKSNPKAFCSIPDLMLATGSSRPTVKKALKLLARLGYLVPLFVTEGGSMMYRLVNARKEIIDDHLRIARTTLAADRADRKKRERKARGVKETCPPQEPFGERNLPPKVKETCPNTVEGIRRVYLYETGDLSIGEKEASLGGIEVDPTVPFAVPDNDNEANEILSHFGNLNPTVRIALRRMLMAGELTPAMLSVNLGGNNG